MKFLATSSTRTAFLLLTQALSFSYADESPTVSGLSGSSNDVLAAETVGVTASGEMDSASSVILAQRQEALYRAKREFRHALLHSKNDSDPTDGERTNGVDANSRRIKATKSTAGKDVVNLEVTAKGKSTKSMKCLKTKSKSKKGEHAFVTLTLEGICNCSDLQEAIEEMLCGEEFITECHPECTDDSQPDPSVRNVLESNTNTATLTVQVLGTDLAALKKKLKTKKIESFLSGVLGMPVSVSGLKFLETLQPSNEPSLQPTDVPSNEPSLSPSVEPSYGVSTHLIQLSYSYRIFFFMTNVCFYTAI